MTTSQPMPPALNWKDHPLVIATGSVVATLLFAWNFVVPLKTADLESKLSSAQQQIDTNRRDSAQSEATLQAQNREIAAKRDALDAELRDAQSRLATFETRETFASGKPYPTGISDIKVGSEFSDVEKVFVGHERRDNGKRISSFELPHAVFSRVTFYKDRSQRGKEVVSQILLHLRTALLHEGLNANMESSFGTPNEVRNGNKAWNMRGVSVVLLDDTVSISPIGTRPGSWNNE